MGKTRASAASARITLDTGALIALDRGDKRMIALLQQVLARGCTFRVPSGVLAQAWHNGRVQATLARFLRAEEVEIVPLDELCGATNTSDIKQHPPGSGPFWAKHADRYRRSADFVRT
jgi:hypothetical protein